MPSPAQFNRLRSMYNIHAMTEVFTSQFQQKEVFSNLWLELPNKMPIELVQLLHNYKSIFSPPTTLPPSRSHNDDIPLMKDAKSVKVCPYWYPHSQQQRIETMVQEMLTAGIIASSTSPFSSLIILIKKKDGTWRFCTDYRVLNAITIKDNFLIPTVDELINELYGSHYFSKIDLRSGYHQILVAVEDRHKTTFRTHQRHYEWLVIPFGLTNALITFQSLVNNVFKDYFRKFVLVFFDDMLVYSPSWSNNLLHLELVLQLLQQHQLYAKLSKCSFGLPQVDYLGHTVSRQGVTMDKGKVQALLQWPVLQNLK